MFLDKITRTTCSFTGLWLLLLLNILFSIKFKLNNKKTAVKQMVLLSGYRRTFFLIYIWVKVCCNVREKPKVFQNESIHQFENKGYTDLRLWGEENRAAASRVASMQSASYNFNLCLITVFKYTMLCTRLHTCWSYFTFSCFNMKPQYFL